MLVLCVLLLGIFNTNWTVSAAALLEYSPAGDKSSYVALSNLINFLPAAVSPIILGMIIGTAGLGYPPAFMLCGVTGVIAVLFALLIKGRKNNSSPSSTVTVEGGL
jgi:MFS family permease